MKPLVQVIPSIGYLFFGLREIASKYVASGILFTVKFCVDVRAVTLPMLAMGHVCGYPDKAAWNAMFRRKAALKKPTGFDFGL